MGGVSNNEDEMLNRKRNNDQGKNMLKEELSRKRQKGLHRDQLSQQAPPCLSFTQKAQCPGPKILLGDCRNVVVPTYSKIGRKKGIQ